MRGHLQADLGYQRRLVRFLENHDEPRIADTLPAVLERAAAVTIATLPGATLWHEGQFEGRRVRPPVFLARRPDEPLDQELAAWYRGLLAVVAEQRVRTGAWQLLEAAGWPDNQSCRNLIAWSWTHGDDADRRPQARDRGQPLRRRQAQGQIRLPWPDLPGRRWRLLDPLSGEDFTTRRRPSWPTPGSTSTCSRGSSTCWRCAD